MCSVGEMCAEHEHQSSPHSHQSQPNEVRLASLFAALRRKRCCCNSCADGSSTLAVVLSADGCAVNTFRLRASFHSDGSTIARIQLERRSGSHRYRKGADHGLWNLRASNHPATPNSATSGNCTRIADVCVSQRTAADAQREDKGPCHGRKQLTQRTPRYQRSGAPRRAARERSRASA